MFKIDYACFGQVIMLFYLYSGHVQAETLNGLTSSGRKIIDDYAGQLRNDYNNAYQLETPGQVSDVCKNNLQPLNINGWKIKRISLRPLDKTNKPDSLEIRVLEDFSLRHAEGWEIERMAYYRLDETANHIQFRYFKAFEYEQRCLTCHGNNVSDDLIITNLGAYALTRSVIEQSGMEPLNSDKDFALPAYKESGNSLR
jgi:hypothetical protein